VEANSLAIQVHGGYGYTRDYPSSSSSATTA
jgi:alkylation response protein AidB-like acyl-CoA dehydrogenase